MRLFLGMVIGCVIGAASMYGVLRQRQHVVSPIIESFARPLDAYAISHLTGVQFSPDAVEFTRAVATTAAYTVWDFAYHTDDPRTGKPDSRLRVTGVAHVPAQAAPSGGYPVIVQFRGYADREAYFPGQGTEHSAEVFASHGFLSLAPDFLGYGGSSDPSTDVFEERFQTYTAALTLLASVQTIPFADAGRVGIWGHSNGGQIALTVLEVSGRPYPASLWAPVSKPFPYSILYYTDEADDRGKLLRRKLAAFESLYDVNAYALTEYLNRIRGTLQIHQGTADEAVPEKWTNEFVALLQKQQISVEYFTYPGADHNLTPGWNTVITRDIEFYRKYLTAQGM